MAASSQVGAWGVIVLISLTLGSGTAAQSRQVGGVGITVFEDPSYHGGSATFRDDVPDLRRFNLNDRVSSLRVAAGELWEACIDIGYNGRCHVFSGREPDLQRLSGWNDEISSLRRVHGDGGRRGVRPPVGGPQIELFDRVGFRGRSRSLTDPQSSLGSFGRAVRSVRVTRGRWEICEGTRWSGRCVTITDSAADIGRLGLSGVSSIRPR
jgi:Beta/Gamma crystallin